MPLALMLPPVADQVTAVLVEPLTLAVNCWVWPACTEADVGDTLTVTAGALVVAALLGDNVQPASERAIRETIATMQIFVRHSRGARSLGDVMLFLFPLFIYEFAALGPKLSCLLASH